MTGIDKQDDYIFNYIKNVVGYLKSMNQISNTFPIIEGKNNQNIKMYLWLKACEANDIKAHIEKINDNKVDILVLD